MLRTRFILIGCLLGMIWLLAACNMGASPREQALEATVAALQTQMVNSPVPVIPATATPVPTPDWRKQLVGLTYPPIPEGWESVGGALTWSDCIVNECPPSEQTYGVAHWRQVNPASGAGEELLTFEKLVGRDADGGAIWTVLDVLVGSEVGGSRWLWQGCRLNDSVVADDEIVPLYSIVLDPSAPAWRANHLTGRFEPISAEGITCIDNSAAD